MKNSNSSETRSLIFSLISIMLLPFVYVCLKHFQTAFNANSEPITFTHFLNTNLYAFLSSLFIAATIYSFSLILSKDSKSYSLKENELIKKMIFGFMICLIGGLVAGPISATAIAMTKHTNDMLSLVIRYLQTGIVIGPAFGMLSGPILGIILKSKTEDDLIPDQLNK